MKATGYLSMASLAGRKHTVIWGYVHLSLKPIILSIEKKAVPLFLF